MTRTRVGGEKARAQKTEQSDKRQAEWQTKTWIDRKVERDDNRNR